MNLKKIIHKNIKLLSPLLIVLLTTLIYFQSLHHDFINFDDDGYVYNNFHVKNGVTISGIKYAFTTMDKGNYIPLTWLSYMIDSEIFGMSPGGYHFTNLLLHIFNSLLLYFFLLNISKEMLLSLFVAMLFAVHPLHVESVAWISERKDVLSSFWGLLSLIFYSKYIRQRRLTYYCLTLLFFSGSLFSKPMLVTLPIILFLIDFWPFKRISGLAAQIRLKALRMLFVEKIPFFFLSLIVCILTVLGQKSAAALSSLKEIPLWMRALNAVNAYAGYVGKTLWPSDLAIIYPYQHNIDIFTVVLNGFWIILLSIFLFLKIRKFPCLFVGWIWFLVTLLPVIGFVQVGTQSMADRYTYFPLIGFFIGIAWGFHYLTIKFKINKRIVGASASAIILTFSMVTLNQLTNWKNSETLFKHAILVTSGNWVAHLNYGEALFEMGHVDDAVVQYKKALKIKPDFELAYLNLGTALARKGQIDNSIDNYKRAIQIKKALPFAWLNMGNAYFKKGKFDEALSMYFKSLKYRPLFPDAYCGIGAVMAGSGKPYRAIQAFKKALKIDPHSISAASNIKKIEKVLKIKKHGSNKNKQ